MLVTMELRTYPWAWYVDDAVLRAEQERIFRRTWQYVGHAGQVAEPVSSFTGRAGPVPIVVADADRSTASRDRCCCWERRQQE